MSRVRRTVRPGLKIDLTQLREGFPAYVKLKLILCLIPFYASLNDFYSFLYKIEIYE